MTQDTSLARAPRAEAAPPKSNALQIKGWMSAPSMQAALRAALSGYMDETTFAAQCYLAAQDPKLAQCSPESLFRAFLECAQMGLLPGSHHRHVALVPRGGLVTVSPQWQGFKFLMERQPGVKRVHPVLVHAKDKFEFVDGVVHHAPDPFDPDRIFEHPDVAKKNNRPCGLRGGYLVIEREGVPVEYHFVGAAKIDKNRRCAQTQDIWTKWFEEMCNKTVLRDAWAKRVISIDPQLAQRLGRADEVDNQVLGNDPTRVTLTASVGHAPAAGSRTAALAARVVAKDVPGTGAIVADEQLPDMAGAPAPAGEEPARAADEGPREEASAAPAEAPTAPPLSEKAQQLALDIREAEHPGALAGVRKKVDAAKGLAPAELEYLRKQLADADEDFKRSESSEG